MRSAVTSAVRLASRAACQRHQLRRCTYPRMLLGSSVCPLHFTARRAASVGNDGGSKNEISEIQAAILDLQMKYDALLQQLTMGMEAQGTPAPVSVPHEEIPVGSGSAPATPIATGNTSLPIKPEMLKSIVKIYSSVATPNYLIPWQKKLQSQATGSGFVMDLNKKLLLTNAHVVACASFVEVRKHGDHAKYTARVIYVGADCDLAVLHVDDEEFWRQSAQATEPLKELPFHGEIEGKSGVERLVGLADLFTGFPDLQRNVKVVGYPMGGDQISITSGVVSRIDSAPYGGADMYLATIQLDAAINPGNSGGPALCDDRIVGIAFQALVSAESIGYIIPIPVISHFLTEFTASPAISILESKKEFSIASRQYHPGFASLGIYMQDMGNETMRAKFGMKHGESGVLVNKVLPVTSATGVLRANDVIMKINDFVIANDATIEWRPQERIRFSHIVQLTPSNSSLKLEILRDKQRQEIEMAPSPVKRLISNHLFNEKFREVPDFLLFGGCVMTTVTLPLLVEWGSNEWYNNAPRWLVQKVLGGFALEPDEELVIIVQVLPHSVNKGYAVEGCINRIVSHVNGEAVRNLAHVAQLLDRLPEGEEDMVTFSLSNTVSEDLLVLPVVKARAADQELRTMYGVPDRNVRVALPQ